MFKTLTRFAPALALGLTMAGTSFGQNADRCHTMQVLDRLQRENPDMVQKMRHIEDFTTQTIQERRMGRTEAVSVTIPVVVHVIYKTAAQNISDAQIQSQIAVLNADYAKMNSDASQVPSLFAGVAAGSGIQFCLAKTDPSGAATTGIERVLTTKTSFSDNDGVKYASSGGANAWDATKYLNIWVCQLGSGLLGYAQFPGGAAATDGVVILNSAFGNTGTAASPYNKGRSATHEVGHWLNLRHIWGDATCGNDYVDDTPTQSTSNYSCPSFPHPTCSNTSDQFMNYMDYVDDACMYMFSAGQVARMEALFATGGARYSLLSSAKCTAGGTTNPGCGVPSTLGATGITQTYARPTWSAVTGASNYTIQYKASTASAYTTLDTVGTGQALFNLTPGTTYTYQVKATCASGTSAYSAAGTFTTLSSGTTPSAWCANAGGSTADEFLAWFKLGTIANSSLANGVNSPGYQDFTSLSTNLLPGSTYSVTYKGGFRSGYSSTEYYRMWIDYNRDGDFTDAGETIFSRTSSSASNLSNTFTVPAGATVGKTRLRIAMKYGSYLSTACTSFTSGWGQVEDYTIILGSSTGRLASEGFTLSVAPNPATDMSLVTATLPEGATTATVRVLDLQGRQVWQAAGVEAPESRIDGYPLPISNLKAGIYILQIEAAGARKVARLVVQ